MRGTHRRVFCRRGPCCSSSIRGTSCSCSAPWAPGDKRAFVSRDQSYLSNATEWQSRRVDKVSMLLSGVQALGPWLDKIPSVFCAHLQCLQRCLGGILCPATITTNADKILSLAELIHLSHTLPLREADAGNTCWQVQGNRSETHSYIQASPCSAMFSAPSRPKVAGLRKNMKESSEMTRVLHICCRVSRAGHHTEST